MGEGALNGRLVAAVRAGDAKTVRALLEKGADPDTVDTAGLPVLTPPSRPSGSATPPIRTPAYAAMYPTPSVRTAPPSRLRPGPPWQGPPAS
jgi:hypothetical protein